MSMRSAFSFLLCLALSPVLGCDDASSTTEERFDVFDTLGMSDGENTDAQNTDAQNTDVQGSDSAVNPDTNAQDTGGTQDTSAQDTPPPAACPATVIDACANVTDATLLADPNTDPASASQNCAFTCFTSPDIDTCVATCVSAATQLSLDCSCCYGKVTECIFGNCLADCAGGGGSSACTACTALNCGADFVACTGSAPSSCPASLADACVGPIDAGILTSPNTDAAATAATCARSCVGSPDIEGCVADCVSADLGLSGDCSCCYGKITQCTIDNCFNECIATPGGPACAACQTVNCGTDFLVCTGTTTTPSCPTTLADACTSSSDTAILADPSNNLFGTSAGCATTCVGNLDFEGCVADCVAASEGLSADCSCCYGKITQCTVANCLTECGANPSSGACLVCQTTNCGGDFLACTGSAPSSCPANLTSACTNSADAAIFADPSADISGSVQTCTVSCLINPDLPGCTADCLSTDTGLSNDCACCYGQSGQCALDNCFTECSADPTGATCTTCQTTNCGAALISCSGL